MTEPLEPECRRESGKTTTDDHCSHRLATALTLPTADRCGRSRKMS
jgi:hypothetical protein